MKTLIHCLLMVLGLNTAAMAASVIVPDNGSGTAAMPILANYVSLEPMHIIDGLAAGSSVTIDATLNTPLVYAEQPGGSLAGTQSAGGGPLFTWVMQGTGVYAGFSRTISFPASGPGSVASFADPAFSVTGASYEIHAAPRTPGAPIQSFNTDLFRLFAQIGPADGDPDFDLLRVVGGTDFGLPSPGVTTLTQTGVNWSADSSFNISYHIDFVGRAGGAFTGLSGTTTSFSPFATTVPAPGTLPLVVTGVLALATRLRRKVTG